MTTYVWAPGSQIPGDAEKVGQRLQQLGGVRVTPRMVVDDARSVESPLHPCFEWDNVRAAELHREMQARYVIRSLHVVQEEGDEDTRPKTIRAFVSVIEDVSGEEQRAYVPLARVLSDAELYDQMLQAALRDLQSFERKYSDISDLKSVASEAIVRVKQLMLPSEVAVGVVSASV